MASLTLKNVPEQLVERLKAEARQSRRSLNQETLGRLERSLVLRFATAEEKVERVRRAQRRFAKLPPFTAEFLDAAKAEGRR